MSRRSALCGLIEGGTGYLPLPRRLWAEFRRVAAVAATGPQIGADPQRGVSCGDEKEEGLEEKTMACRCLLEALSGQSKVKQEKAQGSQASPCAVTAAGNARRFKGLWGWLSQGSRPRICVGLNKENAG